MIYFLKNRVEFYHDRNQLPVLKEKNMDDDGRKVERFVALVQADDLASRNVFRARIAGHHA